MSTNKDNFAMYHLTSASSGGDGADFVNALKNKLQDGKHLDVPESWTANMLKRIDALKEIQRQHDEIEAKFFEERAALEAKYQKLYQPLYAKRYAIVNGEVEVSDAQTEQADKEDRGVPGFWFSALKNNEVVGKEIYDSDEEALKYLKDIKWSRPNNFKGFKLEFVFDSNIYFKNSVLTKTYHMVDEDEPILEKAVGTEIEWYPGRSLTEKIISKKPKNESMNTRPMTKTEKCESFFNFFSPPDVPEDADGLDEAAAEELQNIMELDYDIGSTIRDKIIPHAVSWFTGEAVEDEYDSDDDSDDDEDDDYYFDEDEDDDEDDDSGDTKMQTSEPEGDGPQGARPPECKQQ